MSERNQPRDLSGGMVFAMGLALAFVQAGAAFAAAFPAAFPAESATLATGGQLEREARALV